jgi:hypothetical protein
MYGISVFVLRNERFLFHGLNYDSAQHSAIFREIKEGKVAQIKRTAPSSSNHLLPSFSPDQVSPLLSKHRI